MSCPGRHLRSAKTIGVMFLACAVLSVGCGNPEAPKIDDVRLFYRDFLTGDGNWVFLKPGVDAPQSPVRIQGSITDNTAVVNPKITWIGDRGIDAEDEGFTECSNGTDEFFECKMQCEGPTDGYYDCTPALEAQQLIRGDRFLLTGTEADGQTFEVEVSVSEAQELSEVSLPEAQELKDKVESRIFLVSSLEGDPDVIWSVYQRTNCRTWDGEPEGGCTLDGSSGDPHLLRSGDSVCWHPEVEAEGRCSFQIALKQENRGIVVDSVGAAWQSLVKWNDRSLLSWDATTDLFKKEFQLFDPRARDPDSGELIGEEGAPTYRFVVSAHDVPDQKTGEVRFSAFEVDVLFSPEDAKSMPNLEVDGEDKELIETSRPGLSVGGKVQSFSGEVRSLLCTLSEVPPASCEQSQSPEGQEGATPRTLYLNPESISLTGKFTASIVFVSDWNGDGVVDEPQEEGGIPNFLEVAALDVQGNETRKCLPIEFTPPKKANRPPDLEIQEIYPTVDKKEEGLLPYGEQMRLRARAADDRGQPAFSALECICETDEPPINGDRCPCTSLTGKPKEPWVSLNAGGAYPLNPWDWIRVTPPSPPSEAPRKTIVILRAQEKVEEPRDKPVAKFTSIGIDLEPESESEAYAFKVGTVDSQGPLVTLVNWKNGDPVVDPESFIVEARIYPRFSELNRIDALWNGEAPLNPPPEDLNYDSLSGAFEWNVPATAGREVREGDRICVGGVAADGHATLYILEFANTAEGLRLGATLTPDEGACRAFPD